MVKTWSYGKTRRVPRARTASARGARAQALEAGDTGQSRDVSFSVQLTFGLFDDALNRVAGDAVAVSERVRVCAAVDNVGRRATREQCSQR